LKEKAEGMGGELISKVKAGTGTFDQEGRAPETHQAAQRDR